MHELNVCLKDVHGHGHGNNGDVREHGHCCGHRRDDKAWASHSKADMCENIANRKR